jgi:hypothetical protein
MPTNHDSCRVITRKRVVAYCRCATREQTDSMDRQALLIGNAVERQGYDVVADQENVKQIREGGAL